MPRGRPRRYIHTLTSFAQPAVEYGLIGIDSAIAQKWPVPPRLLALCRIAFDDQHLLVFVRRLCDHSSERVSNKGIAPKLQSRIRRLRSIMRSDTSSRVVMLRRGT